MGQRRAGNADGSPGLARVRGAADDDRTVDVPIRAAAVRSPFGEGQELAAWQRQQLRDAEAVVGALVARGVEAADVLALHEDFDRQTLVAGGGGQGTRRHQQQREEHHHL